MVDVSDPSGIDDKLDRRWAQLEAASIDGRDREAIRAFVSHRRDVEDRARTTLTHDLSTLRCASERADCPLVEMDRTDVRSLLGSLTAPKHQGGYGLARDGSGIFGYKRALRVFFDWLDDEPGYGSYSFHDSIDLPTMDVDGAGARDEMLSPEEIEALKGAARTPRDAALIDFLADTALRVTALLSLRVGDLDLEGDEPSFVLPELEDGDKGAGDVARPILYSRGELRAYLTNHHIDPREEAPLWPVAHRFYDYDAPQSCAVGDDRVRAMLAQCAERAGIDKPVNPHNFRRTALTRLSNSDRLTPQEIQHIAGWADQRMLEVYDYTDDEERNAAIHEAAGFSDGSTDSGPDLTPNHCPDCRTTVSSTTHYCPQCGTDLSEPASEAKAEQRDGLLDDLVEIDDPAARAVIRDLVDRIDDRPGDAQGHEASPSPDS